MSAALAEPYMTLALAEDDIFSSHPRVPCCYNIPRCFTPISTYSSIHRALAWARSCHSIFAGNCRIEGRDEGTCLEGAKPSHARPPARYAARPAIVIRASVTQFGLRLGERQLAPHVPNRRTRNSPPARLN